MSNVTLQGKKSSDRTKTEEVFTTDNAAHTQLPSDYRGTATLWEDANQSTTRGTPTAQPTAGAKVVSIAFADISITGGSDILYVVFNAANDADADSKLAAAGSRQVVLLGERRTWTFSNEGKCTRIDYLTDVAPTGSNLVAGEYII